MAETSREVLSNVNERNMNTNTRGLEQEDHWPGVDASRIDIPGMVNEISDLVLDDYSILQKTPFYVDMMQKIEDALANYENKASGEEVDKGCTLATRALILAIETTKEIYRLYAFVQCCYQLRSVNLNSNIHCPMDYMQVVKKIGNETDLNSVDLEGLLPELELVSVSLGVFASFAKPLPQHILNKTIQACDRAISLHFALKKIFQFVTIVMGPDLAASAESDIAGGLMRSVTPEVTLASASAPPPPRAIDKKTIIKNMSYAARQRAYNQIRRSREALLL